MTADSSAGVSVLAASPLVWALECVRLPTPEGTASFRPYPYQAVLLTDRSPRRLCLKARQTGITTTIAVEVAHEAIFKPRSLCLIVSRDQGAAAHVLDIIYGIFDELDDPPRLLKRGSFEALLENGSRIVSQPATAKSGRGYRATSVVLDEFAYAEYDSRIYRAVSPTLSRGGRLTILSTPNGMANMFYRLWHGDEGGEWSRHNVHWRDCPAFDGAWYERERPKYTAGQWASEFECNFIESAGAGSLKREWFTIIDKAPLDGARVRYWDLAATEGGGDYTVGALVSLDADGLYTIEDIRRVQATPLQVEKLVRQSAELDGIETEVCMEEEPGSSGKSLIDHYRRHVLQGFTLNAVRATGSKLARAGPFASQAEAGNVRLVRGPWVSAFLDECETFPDGPHDDQVDAVAGAVLVLGGSAYRSKAQKRRLAVGMIGYMQRRAPDCPGCGMPVYMPPMSEVGECQYCGRTYVRGEDEARPVTAATGGC